MLSVSASAANGVDLPSGAIVCHDVRNPSQRSEIIARKGTPLQAQEIRGLLSRGVGELHLAFPEPGDVAEDEAAARMAMAVAGPGVRADAARFGQTSLIASERGMLRVDAAGLDRANALEGVLLLTGEGHRPVDAGA